MSIGLAEAASRAGYRFEVALAADSEPAAIRIYQSNLPKAEARVARIEEIFEGAVGAPLTNSENEIAGAVGPVDLLLGGPPCQGHSDLNNHTRRRDPKNALYLRMARAAEVLAPKVVVIENVTPVQWDESGVLKATFEALIASGYQAAGRVLDLRRVGVPQRRRRFVLIASRLATVDPKNVLDHLADATPGHQDRTVRWAIEDLINCNLATVYDTASQTSKENAKRIRFLFEKRLYDLPNENRPKCHRDRVHSYVSMYGRLHWNEPAQTITTGFGSMGQGRYVHPQRRRTITPHEAARLQTFPDWFDFGEKTPRGVIAQAIGNAVPPLLMLELGNLVLPALSCPPDVERLQA
jgi:DNA (cytosine-5)-methyltransferase 1